MPTVFENHGIRLQYPENWKLQESVHEADGIEIQLAAPSGAFWSVSKFPAQLEEAALMRAILDSIRENYESVESTTASESIANYQMAGFDNYFFCLDLLIANRMRCFQRGQFKYFLMYQAENREFDQLEAVFNAITLGMLADSTTQCAV